MSAGSSLTLKALIKRVRSIVENLNAQTVFVDSFGYEQREFKQLCVEAAETSAD